MELFIRSTLQCALYKIKIKLLENDQNCLRHRSSTKPLLSLCKGDNTTKKNEKINLLWNTGHLDEKSDVKHHIFRCLISKKCRNVLKNTMFLKLTMAISK